MKEIKTVSIIGLGNLGVAFGDHLSKNMPKDDLRFIADPRRIERYEKEKIYSTGTPATSSTFRPNKRRALRI